VLEIRKAGGESDQPVFYYDLGSPEAYVTAERVHETLGVVPEWRPVLAARLPAGELAFRCAEERDALVEDIERRVAARGMQPMHWPDRWPFHSEPAMRAAEYARGIGRGVAFSFAAFRQAFAAGRDLSVPDNLVIAAAACEMHPAAVLKAIEMRSVADGLRRATEDAEAAGVTRVPAVRVGTQVFEGDEALEAAATAVAA
jgi:2-hydroxychromene-2-carboxylate isomerase